MSTKNQVSELTPQQWEFMGLALQIGQIESFNDWLINKNLQSVSNEPATREEYFVDISNAISTIGANNIHEPQALFVEPFHLFTNEEANSLLSLIITELSTADLKTLGLSILDTALVRRYLTVEAVEAGAGFSAAKIVQDLVSAVKGKKLALFDPLYGMALVKRDGRWKCVCFAENLWILRASRVPENMRAQYLQRRLDALCEGVMFANKFFSAFLPGTAKAQLQKFEVPELVVHCEDELNGLIKAMSDSLHNMGSGFQLWFRGQPIDYLVPDRAPLFEKRIAGYCSVRDSSLVPSLYRYIDSYYTDPDQYCRFIRHVGDWNMAAKLLLPPMSTILDEEGKPYVPRPVSDQAQCRITFYMAGRPHKDIPGLQDLGPYNLWEIIDTDGSITDRYIKLFHPSLQSHNTTLLLQHYGCPTGWLDITKSIDIALWFALNKMESTLPGKFKTKRYEWSSQDSTNWPTLYIFPLHPEMHPFVDTSLIHAGSKFLRPQVQKCGLLGGAGNLCRNYAARFIAAKIRLGPEFQNYQTLPTEALFPDKKDMGLQELLEHQNHALNDKLFPVYEVAN